MVDEYISREALIKGRHACKRDCTTCDFAIDDDSWCEGELFVVDVLRAPAADVVERKRGEWIEDACGAIWCSVCSHAEEACEQKMYRYNFCPNCGADMREEEEG